MLTSFPSLTTLCRALQPSGVRRLGVFTLFFALCLGTALPAAAQERAEPDRLFLNDDSSVEVVVVEVLPGAIKYRRWSNPSGPVYTVEKSDVRMVLYANGEHESYGPSVGADASTMSGSGPAATASGASSSTSHTGAAEDGAAAGAVLSEEERARNWRSHLGLGFPETGGYGSEVDVTAFGLSYGTDYMLGALAIGTPSPIQYGVGIEANVMYFEASYAGSSVVSGLLWAGGRGYGEYSVSERVRAHAALGFGKYFAIQEGGDVSNAGGTDAVFTLGASYYFTKNWALSFDLRPDSAPASFTIGLVKRHLSFHWLY